MKNIGIILSLFSLLVLASCTDPLECPEKNIPFICEAESFVGTWEYVAPKNKVGDGVCLSILDLDMPRPHPDITITLADNTDKIVYNHKTYSTAFKDGCNFRVFRENWEEHIFTDNHLELINSNYLIVCNRDLIFASEHLVYRKKS